MSEDTPLYQCGRFVRVISGVHRNRYGYVRDTFTPDRTGSRIWLSASEAPYIHHVDLKFIPQVPLIGSTVVFDHANGKTARIVHTTDKGEIVLSLLDEVGDHAAWHSVDYAEMGTIWQWQPAHALIKSDNPQPNERTTPVSVDQMTPVPAPAPNSDEELAPLDKPALHDRIKRLAREAEMARNRAAAYEENHKRDIETLSKALLAAAEQHDFCTEFDDFVEEINRNLIHEITPRRRDFEIYFTVSGTVLLQATSEDDAREQFEQHGLSSSDLDFSSAEIDSVDESK